jgi:hypothetical protein
MEFLLVIDEERGKTPTKRKMSSNNDKKKINVENSFVFMFTFCSDSISTCSFLFEHRNNGLKKAFGKNWVIKLGALFTDDFNHDCEG